MTAVPHDPGSRSEVLASTHILVVAVEEVRMGEWMPEPEGPLVRRFVEIALRLEEVLAGMTDQVCGESVVICVEQRGSGSRRVADDYGIWSKVELGPGQRLVAFCQGDAGDAAALLLPPACTQLAGVDALPDVRTSLDLERRTLPPKELVTRAAPLFDRRGGILARYVWARVSAGGPADEEVFDGLMQIVERPDTMPEARDVLLTSALDDLSMMEAPPRAQVLRLVRAMLALLTLREAEALHVNVSQVYLPNLIGLPRGKADIAAAEVFTAGDGALARVQAALGARSELDPEGGLRRWLGDTALARSP